MLLGAINEPDEAETIAARLADTLSAPMTLHGIVVPVAASIGIAIHTPDMDGVDALLRAADVAMYGAKARGKDRYQVYTSDQDPGDDRLPAGRVGARGAAAASTADVEPRTATPPLLTPEGA